VPIVNEHNRLALISIDPAPVRRDHHAIRYWLPLVWLMGFSLIVLFSAAVDGGNSPFTFLNQVQWAAGSPITATLTVTNTITNTPVFTQTPTVTASPTLSPTLTATPLPTATPAAQLYMPVFRMSEIRSTEPPPPPTTHLFCDNLSAPRAIPDDNPSGVADTIDIQNAGYLTRVAAFVDINHTWTGDLSLSLTHLDTSHTITLLDRPGVPANENGCGGDNLQVLFDDRAAQPAENKCASSIIYSGNAIGGTFLPQEPLAAFTSDAAGGSWRLEVADHNQFDEGTLNHWCLDIAVADAPIVPTPTPTAIPLPPSAYVGGMHGQPQQYPLDCESRAAVDWAAHFGVHIDELEFFYRLPVSDNPDRGFVGNVMGTWGYTPPHDYGVHAKPIADLLQKYGVSAVAARSLSFDELRSEIAAGRPVLVWITGKTDYGAPLFYTAQNGEFMIVARYEHTVNVIGYDGNNVTILDGSSIYTRSISHFLDSWSALRFMAVLAGP
jgi:uncharacterized protein YvpB/subtilisin-like proprotein convertase family protein